ncbi:MAG: ROK family protein [Acidimicrobiales bacterium]
MENVVVVLDLLRFGLASTRPELAQRSGLGRAVVSQQLSYLTELGLVREGDLAPSTGGRAPRSLAFRAEAGVLLVAELGATSLAAGLSDLAGDLLFQHEEPFDISEGPRRALDRLASLFDALVDQRGLSRASLWGIGLGVPGPVEFSTGRPISPPIMPGWHAYPIRRHLGERFGLPVWVDNDVNLMALGELRSGQARGEQNMVYVKIGTGIGAGIVCRGQLYRGAQGCAGDIGHVAVREASDVVCRCGKGGCLEALAGGAALGRDGTRAAESGLSPHLAAVLDQGREVTGEEITKAAQRGDPVALELLLRSGRLVGEVLATIVNFYNPALILVGGGVAAAGDALLASIRENVYRCSLPLATRDLQISFSPLGDQAGLRGAAAMVTDEVFAPPQIVRWLAQGNPAAMTGLLTA